MQHIDLAAGLKLRYSAHGHSPRVHRGSKRSVGGNMILLCARKCAACMRRNSFSPAVARCVSAWARTPPRLPPGARDTARS